MTKKTLLTLMIVGLCGCAQNPGISHEETDVSATVASSISINQSEAGSVHAHVFVEETEDPTCEGNGAIIERCDCGYYYVKEIIPAIGHDYDVTGRCTNKGCASNISFFNETENLDFLDLKNYRPYGSGDLQVYDHKAYMTIDSQCSSDFYINTQDYQETKDGEDYPRKIIRNIHLYKGDNLGLDLYESMDPVDSCLQYWEYTLQRKLDPDTVYYCVFDVASSYSLGTLSVSFRHPKKHSSLASWVDSNDGTYQYEGCQGCGKKMGGGTRTYIQPFKMEDASLSIGMSVADIKNFYWNQAPQNVTLQFGGFYLFEDTDKKEPLKDIHVFKKGDVVTAQMKIKASDGYVFNCSDSDWKRFYGMKSIYTQSEILVDMEFSVRGEGTI